MLKSKGYTVKESCLAFGLSRSVYYSQIKPKRLKITDSEKELVDRIKEIKMNHPFWGYRRVHAWLSLREKLMVSQKAVRRAMKNHGLGVNQSLKKAKRKSSQPKPRADRPNQFWGIDMTKFTVAGLGWIYLHIVLDWFTKEIVGYEVSLHSRTADWKKAMEMAVNKKFAEGVREKGLKLISDNGSQPTSTNFMKEMSILGIEQIFTAYNNPKGNAETERMMRTIKEELLWLNEFESFEEAKRTVSSWIENEYNRWYPHSALGYKSPLEFEKACYAGYISEVA